MGLVMALVGAAVVPAAAGLDRDRPIPGTVPTPSVPTTRCPWLARAMARHDPPGVLAALTVGRMTLPEKLGELVLSETPSYENVDLGVPSLCIPSLTLQDGPDGLSAGDTGVTALPAPLGVASSFDPALVRRYGRVEGTQARGQGIDVVQGPDLNLDRVPEDGRAYETYGEDPTLAAALGVADIEGMQSAGVMADAKHLVAYNQETNRRTLDAVVSPRALQELYLAPFRAAVTDAHVASIMCAYPRLDGTYQCQDPQLSAQLTRWGFTGFVRSDLGAVHDPVAALEAGTDLVKPASVANLTAAVGSGRLPVQTVDEDVTRLLTQMFAFGLVGRPSTGVTGTPVATAADTALALEAAERSAVLLKNAGSVLPLDRRHTPSVAVIGADASSAPVTEGYGSSYVTPPFVSSPLDAIRSEAGPGTAVTYADGGSTTVPLPDVPTADLTPAVGAGHGLTVQVAASAGASGGLQLTDPVAGASISNRHAPTATPRRRPATPRRARRGAGTLGPPASWGRLSPDGSNLTIPDGWRSPVVTWSGTLVVPRSGLYTFSLSGSGTATLALDGAVVVADSEKIGTWAGTADLVGGQRYRLSMSWRPVGALGHGHSTVHVGMMFGSAAIAQAVTAARAARVAVVFASDFSSEGFDRPSLALPGDQNALIDAVAAANPRTVVVLNTGGPVVMPWLDRVAAVIEDWYPGEEDGTAIAAVLYGEVDPSGHLPVTFPVSQSRSAIDSTAQWPGVGLTSTYSEGLDVGYRYDNATGTAALFPFGFGLSYTTFAFGDLQVRTRPDGSVALTCTVSNTGGRAGTEVVQAYLTYPVGAGEPPGQLVAFAPVTVPVGTRRTVTLDVPARAFEVYLGSGWRTVPGRYELRVGDSSVSTPLGATVDRSG